MLLGRNAAWLLLIMKLGPGRTPWNRTFTALERTGSWVSWRFWLARRSRIVKLMVSA